MCASPESRAYSCGHRGWRHGRSRYYGNVPVNIEEKADTFELSLFAPDLQKESFRLSVKNDTLTISYTGAETPEQSEQFTRREYRRDTFERSFVLNGKVEADRITASYSEGILKVILPKNPQTNRPPQDITVN